MALSRLLARPLLASYFVANGINDLTHTKEVAAKAAPVTAKIAPAAQQAAQGAVPVPTEPETWVRAAGAVQVVAGLCLATGRLPRLSALVLGATLIPSTAARHPFWASSGDAQADDLVHFVKNVAIGGGTLLAALDTEGRPGLLWRTKHVTGHAAHVVHDAKREAQLTGAKAAKALVGH
jgi:uncharacterized membrane protein YphA (DoxX/SURF4 family)